jgi:hypothetical protein
MAGNAALSPGITRFLAGPLVRGALLMGSLTTFTGNLALLGAVHRRKSTIFLGHVVLPPSLGFWSLGLKLPAGV